MKTIINVTSDQPYFEGIAETAKLAISLEDLIQLYYKHNIKNPKLEVNFSRGWYGEVYFESINLVGESDEKDS